MKLGRGKRINEDGRVRVGRCPRCGMEGAKLVASDVLEAEVCTHCLVAGAAGMGWLRDSDVRVLPGQGRAA